MDAEDEDKILRYRRCTIIGFIHFLSLSTHRTFINQFGFSFCCHSSLLNRKQNV